ncbi:hypothetical protein ES708_27176 [subsurface metagenome]
MSCQKNPEYQQYQPENCRVNSCTAGLAQGSAGFGQFEQQVKSQQLKRTAGSQQAGYKK